MVLGARLWPVVFLTNDAPPPFAHALGPLGACCVGVCSCEAVPAACCAVLVNTRVLRFGALGARGVVPTDDIHWPGFAAGAFVFSRAGMSSAFEICFPQWYSRVMYRTVGVSGHQSKDDSTKGLRLDDNNLPSSHE